MKVKDLIAQLKGLDPETEIGTIEDFYFDGTKMQHNDCYLGEFFVDDEGAAFHEDQEDSEVRKMWAIAPLV